MKKTIFLSNTGSISSIIQLLFIISPSTLLCFTKSRDWLVFFIQKNPRITIWIIVLLLCLSIYLLIRLILFKHNTKKSTIPYGINDTPNSPYILIVDNDQNILDAFEEKNFKALYPNTSLSLSLPNVNMTRGFDIVISDIVGAGYNQTNALNLLISVKENYPSKMVCAMSSHTGYQTKTKGLDKFFFKDKKSDYVDLIAQEIKQYWNGKNLH